MLKYTVIVTGKHTAIATVGVYVAFSYAKQCRNKRNVRRSETAHVAAYAYISNDFASENPKSCNAE